MSHNPTRFACSNADHRSTRVICECAWFDGCCHGCPSPSVDVLPDCMERDNWLDWEDE